MSKALVWELLVLLPGSVAALLWRLHTDGNAWFPMEVGDRWTYAEGSSPDRVVFEVIGRDPTRPEAFVVERRIRRESVAFVVTVRKGSVRILGTSKGEFDPPFEEFRLPPVQGASWSYEGRFGGRPVRVSTRVESVGKGRCEIVEGSSVSGATTFTLERGKGVVRLRGKANDPHGFGSREFDWTLEKFERKD